MECQKFKREISALLDGELTPSVSEALAEHLDRCVECRQEYERMADLDRSLHAMEVPRPDPLLAAKVKARLSELRHDKGEPLPLPAWSRVPLMVMIVLLALGLGNLAGRSMTELGTADRQEVVLESLVPDAGHSFADVIASIDQKEEAR